MGLVLWMPCIKDLHNQGLVGTNPTGTCTYEAGKIGNCAKVTSTIDTGLSSDKWDYSTKSISFGGWFKFNKAEMQAAVLNKSTNTKQRFPSFNLLGKNSYNGFALSLYTNDIYNPTADLTSLNIQASMRSSTALWTCGFGTIEWDTWIHLFITWDFDSKTFTAYKNGTKVSSWTISNWGGDFTYRGTFNIADNAIFGGNGPVVIMPFRVNDVRVYDHCLSPKEVKEIAKGLVLHYPLNDAYVEGTTNLVTSITKGGQTTVNGYEVTTSGVSKDTYFTLNLSEKIVAGNTYTISCRNNFDTGLYWDFPIGGQANQTLTWRMTSGYSSYTFVANSSNSYWNKNTCFMDDLSGTARNAGKSFKMWDWQIEKKDHATPFVIGTRNETTVYDCSGYQNNGTITGSLSCSADSPRYKISTETSSSRKVQKSAFLPSAITHYTISVWCKITDPNAAANLWTKHSNGSKGIVDGFGIGSIYSYNGGGLLTSTSFLNTSGTIAMVYPNFGQNYKDGNWHMYTIVGNGNTNICYLDGLKTNSSTLSNFVSYYIKGTLSIGYTETCLISDFRMYATALSAEDIKELYNTSAYVSDNGTLLTYNLEE